MHENRPLSPVDGGLGQDPQPSRESGMQRYIFSYGSTSHTCPTCDRTFFDHVSFKKHVLAHGGICSYLCSKCQSAFPSIYSVSGHYRKCKSFAPPPSPPVLDYRCECCIRSFSTTTGLSLHRKRAHPVEFNAGINISRVKARWSTEETRLLALAELNLGNPPNINELLRTQFPGRTLEAIKGKRKQRPYKDLLQNIKLTEELADTPEVTFDPEPIPPPFPPPPETSIPIPSTLTPQSQFSQGDPSVFDHLLHLSQQGSTSREAQHLIVECLDNPKLALHLLDKFILLLFPPNHRHHVLPKSGLIHRARRRHHRIKEYALIQSLYKKDRTKAARMILDGRKDAEVIPSLEDITTTYGELFSSESPPDPSDDITAKSMRTIYYPVNTKEIQEALKACNNSAPGPDGITLTDVKTKHKVDLAVIFNICLWCHNLPQSFKTSRTTLIPKSGDLSAASNWRPITVSSILLRIFHKILAKRLSQTIYLSPAQRAFLPTDGTGINTFLLDALIQRAKKARREIHITTLDIAKAFDSISHHSIVRALKRSGFDLDSIQYIRSSLEECTTTIYCGPTMLSNVLVRRGVKQGDPLSPLLFNLVIDELFSSLDPTIGGKIQETTIPAIGFADDIILLSSSTIGMENHLRNAAKFFQARNLNLKPEKCQSLSLIPEKKSRRIKVLDKSQFFLSGKCIPPIAINETFKYLGVRFGANGKTTPDISKFLQSLERLIASPLKPQQKIFILRIYAIPRLVHSLSLGRYSLNWLKTIDSKIRQVVKSILRLPSSLANSCLYASLRDGGFSIPCLAQAIPRNTLARLVSIKYVDDKEGEAFASSPEYYIIRKRCLKALGKNPTKESQRAFWRESLHTSINGRGLDQIQESPGNSWFGKGTRFTNGRTYINLCRLRTNSLMCREMNSRGRPETPRTCRGKCPKVESLSHILQGCPATHWFRVTRHNRLLALVHQKFTDLGFQVILEPRITLNGQLRKPDLILLQERQVIVCDLTVGWETPQSLDDRHTAKVDYYGTHAMKTYLTNQWPQHEQQFQAIALSCRGGISSLSYSFLRSNGWRKSDIGLLCLRCMEKSLTVYWGFFTITFGVG